MLQGYNGDTPQGSYVDVLDISDKGLMVRTASGRLVSIPHSHRKYMEGTGDRADPVKKFDEDQNIRLPRHSRI